MSILIANLTFASESNAVNASKTAILLTSLMAGTIGFLWLKLLGKPEETDEDLDAVDFEVTEI